ncbi:MAG: RidA family protein [Acidimicrobiia bacterium]|nr:MAG: RidA family protein [Acidimicrobiia bacterium]
MPVTRHHGISPYEQSYGFSRAVRVGDAIHVAGTAPVPEPGEELAEGAYAQMLRCGAIAREAIEALDGAMTDVVRTRMFIVDAGDADDIGRAHRKLFGGSEPAATMVVVAGLLDPEWLVEIEVEVVLGSSVMRESMH